MKMLKYLMGVVVHPIKTIEAFNAEPKRMKYSFLAACIGAAAMAISCVPKSIISSAPAIWTLPIIFPIALLIWIFPPLCFFPLYIMFKGKGKVQDHLATAGLPAAVFMIGLSIAFLLENITIAGFEIVWQIVMILFGAWGIFLMIVGNRKTHQVGVIRATLAILLPILILIGWVLLHEIH
jgi:hypothetical protein